MVTKNIQRLIIILVTLNAPFATASTMAPYEIPNTLPSKIILPWSIDHIVKPEDIHCYKTTAPSNDELRAEILHSRSGKKANAKIAGVTFRNEDTRLLDILEKLLKDRSGHIPTAIQSEFGNQATQPLDVIDAAQRIFGEREGLQLLYLFMRYRINGSHIQAVDTSPWEAAELDSIILGLSDLPEHLIPFPIHRYNEHLGYQPIFRHKRGEKINTTSGAGVIANAEMTFFDKWSEQPSELARRVAILHEASHNLQYLITDAQNWTNLSPWPKKIVYAAMSAGKAIPVEMEIKTTYRRAHEEPFVTGYSKASPIEDFAESVTAYRYAPLWLLERNPEKYEYLREVIFDGIEYLSEETCKKGNLTARKNHEAALVKAFTDYQLKLIDGGIPSITDSGIRKEKARCDFEFIKNRSTISHDQCVSTVYTKWFTQKFRSEFIKFENDAANIRAADGTGGMPVPKMNYYLKAKIGNASRTAIRKAFTEDFNTYKSKNGTKAPNCNHFSILFTNWLTNSDAKTSAVVRAGIHDSTETDVTARFLKLVCEKGVETRPNYVDLLEKFKGQGPLSASEFRYGIREAIP